MSLLLLLNHFAPAPTWTYDLDDTPGFTYSPDDVPVFTYDLD